MTDTEIIPIPEGAGNPLQLLVFEHMLYLVCEAAVFVLVDGQLQPVPIVGSDYRILH